MTEFEFPTYALDWTSRNISRLETLKEGREADVLVYQIENRQLPSMPAKALLNGNKIDIVVRTADGVQSHAWTYEFLRYKIQTERNK